MNRFERHLGLFGAAGQDRLRRCHVAVVGIGGLGSIVVQQLALLGVGGLTLIDSEELADTDRNRNPLARLEDPVPGTWKVDLAERFVHSVDPAIQVVAIRDSLLSRDAFAAIREADYVMGCLDSEGARLVLTELCSAYERPYLDLASDVVPDDSGVTYGGHVVLSTEGKGCLVCLRVLDLEDARQEMEGPEARKQRLALYGVTAEMLDTSGPSVVSMNGLIASLGVTEFMVHVTGLREPVRHQTYRGHAGRLTNSKDTPGDCHFCGSVRGQGADADVERYLREGVGAWLR